MKAFDLFFDIPLVMFVGFILDLFLGDPEVIPHPIVLIGKLVSSVESIIRKVVPGNRLG